jgi:hypothetical protein
MLALRQACVPWQYTASRIEGIAPICGRQMPSPTLEAGGASGPNPLVSRLLGCAAGPVSLEGFDPGLDRIARMELNTIIWLPICKDENRVAFARNLRIDLASVLVRKI